LKVSWGKEIYKISVNQASLGRSSTHTTEQRVWTKGNHSPGKPWGGGGGGVVNRRAINCSVRGGRSSNNKESQPKSTIKKRREPPGKGVVMRAAEVEKRFVREEKG